MEFPKVVLYTDADGRARWREEIVPLDQGRPQVQLSRLMSCGGYQLRRSPPGFASDFAPTPSAVLRKAALRLAKTSSLRSRPLFGRLP